MKLKITKNQFPALISKLERMREQIPERGETWARNCAIEMQVLTLDHLENQGRGTGAPPPLSRLTLRSYSATGGPDGSGIRNHLTLEFHKRRTGFTAVLGIPEGQPADVARLQDQGGIVPVTESMRGFLAAELNIHLRAETTHFVIPPRRFWTESLQKARDHAIQQLSLILQV